MNPQTRMRLIVLAAFGVLITSALIVSYVGWAAPSDDALNSAANSTATAGQSSGSDSQIRAVFTCSGGKSINAVFMNGPADQVQLVLSDGRQVTLPHAISADGARYANKDESFVFWNKGNTAFITEKDVTTFDGCVTHN